MTVEKSQRKAVVLLSGGLDSYTAAAIARAEGHALYALTVRYGQVHAREIDAARAVARALGVARHLELAVDLAAVGGSALTGAGEVPKDRPLDEGGIPATYVPARNTVLLALALAWAEVVGAEAIVLGVNAVDYSGYPDCRPEYVAAFERMANLATKSSVEGRPIRIRAPIIDMPKASIIREGVRLGIDYAMTVSCYQADDDGRACGRCDACRIRRDGFAAAGVKDPTRYR